MARHSPPKGKRPYKSKQNRVSSTRRSVNEVLRCTIEKKKAPRQHWLPKYVNELGIRPFSYKDFEVIEAICQFCTAFGREDEDKSKSSAFGSLLNKKQRKKKSKAQIFTSFRRDHITAHMESQHPRKWEAFQALQDVSARVQFFLPKMIEHFLPALPAFDFEVPPGIVSIIRRFFCNSDDGGVGLVQVDATIGEVTMARDFVETTRDVCVLFISNREQFETVLRCIRAGVSFRATEKMFFEFGTVLGNMKLGSPDRNVIGRQVRFVVALNLTAIRFLLNNTWGFSILVDAATHRREGYLDVRVSFGLLGGVHNVHLLAVPLGQLGHTGANFAQLVLGLLEDIGGKNLMPNLLGVSSDGAANMLGRHRGFSTRLRNAAQLVGNTSVVINWCGSHQLNLVVNEFLRVLDRNVNFRSRLGSEISFTRKHESVRLTVGLCPTYSPTRWESIHDACHFLLKNYVRLGIVQDEKAYTKSSDAWWLCLFVVCKLSEKIRACFRKLQYKTVTMREQYAALDELHLSLALKFESDSNDEGAPTVDSAKVSDHLQWCCLHSKDLFDKIAGQHNAHTCRQGAEVGIAGMALDQPNIHKHQDGEEALEVLAHLADMVDEDTPSSHEDEDMPQLNEVDEPTESQQSTSQQGLVEAVTTALTVMIDGIADIKLDIAAETRDAPPTRPIDIVKCTDGAFRRLLIAHSAKLREHLGESATEEIWSQRKNLIHEYKLKSDVCRKVKDQGDLSLEDAWAKVDPCGEFGALTEFAVGLASIAPGTHTVEGDFSTLNRVAGPQRGRLSTYAVEGELQARQYFEVMELADRLESSKKAIAQH